MPTITRNGNVKRVGFSPDQLGDYRAVITLKACLDPDVGAMTSNKCSRNKHNNMQRGISSSSSSSSSAASRIFHSISASMARAIRHLFTKKQSSCSSGVPVEMVNIQSSTNFVPHRDSHHSEAFEDCIEFINSSYRKSL